METYKKTWKMSFKCRWKVARTLAWSMEGLPRWHVAFLCMVDASHFYTAARRGPCPVKALGPSTDPKSSTVQVCSIFSRLGGPKGRPKA